MIKNILLWFLWLLVLAFVVVWLWTGGAHKAWNAGKSLTSVVDMVFFRGKASGIPFRLPWQLEPPSGIILAQDSQTNPGGASQAELEQKLASLENDYSKLSAQAEEAKTFGNPSPFRGRVGIAQSYGAQEASPSAEYIVLGANSANTSPVDITGWSVQSAYTGARGYITRSASPFVMGSINNTEATQLNPGATAIINSGFSPVGISFRENICTGYLAQFQSFSPSLSNSCPTPLSQIPLNADNLRFYGDTCYDFLQTVPSCTSPFQSIPSNISPNCRSFALNMLSYNGCVSKNMSARGFASNSWRIYLGSNVELWRNSHDIIRLLDGSGQTVDVLTY